MSTKEVTKKLLRIISDPLLIESFKHELSQTDDLEMALWYCLRDEPTDRYLEEWAKMTMTRDVSVQQTSIALEGQKGPVSDEWKDEAFKNAIQKNLLCEMLEKVLDKIDNAPNDTRYLSVTKPARELISKLKADPGMFKTERQGPVWVKAHERFPANDSPVYVRCSHGKKILYSTELGWFDFESDKMYMCHDDKNEKTIEWLSDESPSPAQQSITSVINTSPDDIVTSDLISYWRNNPSSPQPEGEKEKFSADVLNWMIQIGIKHNLRGWYQEGIFSCDYYSTEDLLTLYKSSLETNKKI